MKDKNKLWKELEDAIAEVLEETRIEGEDMLDVIRALDNLKEAYGQEE